MDNGRKLLAESELASGSDRDEAARVDEAEGA
jgi:hypothetical protein